MKSEKKIEGQKMSGSGAKTAKPYVYHKQLSFLKKIAMPNIIIIISSMESRDTAECNEKDCSNENTNSNQYNDSNNKEQVDKLTKLPRISNNVQHKRPSTSKLSPIDAKMMKFMDSFPSRAEPTNRHISLFHGLVPTLDKFNDDQVLDFQLGVIKLIKEIKKNSITQQQTVEPQAFSSYYSTSYYNHNASSTPNMDYVNSSLSSHPVSQASNDSSSYSETDSIDFTSF